MKKIPTLFKRVFDGHKIIDITPEVTEGCEEALREGMATIKYDGACCAFIDGVFYKRYDCKQGKTPPVNAIPCCEPDPITGHWPHWVPVNENDPADKWFLEAYKHSAGWIIVNGTYEAIGPHFNGNPYNIETDILFEHGIAQVEVGRDFESIKQYLEEHEIEGLVFWLDGEPVCKIKRSDFGFSWHSKKKVRG